MIKCKVIRNADIEQLNPCKALKDIIDAKSMVLFETNCFGNSNQKSFICKPNIVKSSQFNFCPYCGVDIAPEFK